MSAFARLRHVRFLIHVETLLAHFSAGERMLLYALSITLAGSAFALLAYASAAVSVEIPVRGGVWIEGEVGPARFINPLLTLSQPDEDIAALVYSGLTRVLPDGSIIPDLASSYDVSTDGVTYTFHMRKDATFHDGNPVTAEDVAFTIKRAQNPNIKSIHRADWDGVSVSTPDAHTVIFKLPHAYAPFIENTTLGILPKHLWENVSDEEFLFNSLNTRPVGTGPYRVASVVTDRTGAALSYELVPFDRFSLGTPYLKRIVFRFYQNDAAALRALNTGEINALAGVSPSSLAAVNRPINIVRVPLPRIFGIFFNQTRSPALSDISVRAALEKAINKQEVVKEVLNGEGVVLDGPIPHNGFGTATPFAPEGLASNTNRAASNEALIESAKHILEKGMWTFSTTTGTWSKKVPKSKSVPSGKLELAFTLATADSPELVGTANRLADAWRQLGVAVDVHVYPISELNTVVIRPRAYDAILFGEVVGRSMDLFAFWHSSQRNDPGLNLALYTNSKADTLLSQARATIDRKKRESLYDSFASIIEEEKPALFLYAPNFLYLVPPSVHGIEIGTLTVPAERFLTAYAWYAETEHVWNIFAQTLSKKYHELSSIVP